MEDKRYIEIDFPSYINEVVFPSDEIDEAKQIKLPRPMIFPHKQVFPGREFYELGDHGGFQKSKSNIDLYGGFRNDRRYC